MKINWFPGHMKKAQDEIKNNLKMCDIVIYVLDARAPFSTLNQNIDSIVDHKPVLYVLNKSDLADMNKCQAAVKKLTGQGKKALIFSNDNAKRKLMFENLYELLKEKIEKAKTKTIKRQHKIMVIGVPNTGKSTIINMLCGNKKVMVGDKAGVTRSSNWVKAGDDFVMLDTPGVLLPDMKEQYVADNLAYIGSVKDDVLDLEEIGFKLFKKLLKIAPNELKTRYKLTSLSSEEIELYDQVGKNMGTLIKGEVDYLRLGKMIISDFRNARIGNISLE